MVLVYIVGGQVARNSKLGDTYIYNPYYPRTYNHTLLDMECGVSERRSDVDMY